MYEINVLDVHMLYLLRSLKYLYPVLRRAHPIITSAEAMKILFGYKDDELDKLDKLMYGFACSNIAI